MKGTVYVERALVAESAFTVWTNNSVSLFLRDTVQFKYKFMKETKSTKKCCYKLNNEQY